ncbi:MAG: ATP-binding cassette domain-containing protein [Candidatus Levybacteria bacterium]|nr:ATP-binding cassette domain-containing protein [Candidatus Levybacteria bacterium]
MIKFDKVSKAYGTGSLSLSEITVDIGKGEFIFLVGPTGSGKTTIFRLLIRDLLPSTGSIIVGDFDIVKLPHKKIPHLRKMIGVIFQDLKLLTDRTIFENIILPLEVIGLKTSEAKKRVEEVLHEVGIEKHRNKFPIQLSGGELQKAAIARALVLSPDILLADEPTGNLDPVTGKEIIKLLLDINEKGTTIIMATHNADVVNSHSKRVIALEKGRLVRDEKKGKYGVS